MKRNTSAKQKTSEAFGSRVFAGIIDFILWIILFIVADVAFGTSTTTVYGRTKSTNVSLTGLPFLIFILLGLAYFVILEWQLGGTVGKLLLGVRVVNEDDKPIAFKQSVIRNVLRVVDAFPYIVPYVTGLILVAGDEHKRRLGDRVANTQVVMKTGYGRKNSWSNLS